MSAVTIDQALQLALGHHQAGRLDQAQEICRQILAQHPDHAITLHYLGVLSAQQGGYDQAITLLSQAAAHQPENADLHLNLSEYYRIIGDLDQSIAASRRAIQIRPDFAEAHNNLGLALTARGAVEEAIAALSKALELIDLRARTSPERSAAIFAHAAPMHANLGNALRLVGRHRAALDCYQTSLRLNPHHAEAHASLGGTLREIGRLDESITALRRAIELDPSLAEAHNNLAIALGAIGRHAESLAEFAAAIALKPDRADFASNRLYSLAYLPETGPAELLAEARAWNCRHGAPLARHILPHSNDRSPARRLRIGYLSPDFRNHPVSAFFMPLLAHHDAAQVEVFCYSTSLVADAVTARLQSLSHHWSPVEALSDDALAAQIRTDQIDILVDLALHTRGGRLLVFARKPAPLQVTWLGYAGTTGLDTIDYRLTDPWLDPSGPSEPFYAEKSIRLPHCFWCYQPLVDTPLVNTLPALAAGHVTFACLNNFAKVSPPAMQAWFAILAAVERSRLLVNCPNGSPRQELRQQAAAAGIDPSRLAFTEHRPIDQYYAQYHDVDIALDSLPYCGGTTTCDALWMGVPVVTLCGHTAVGRAGRSILSNAGHEGLLPLITTSVDEYVQTAIHAAADLPALARLRAELRPAMQASPLMNGQQFAADMERIYRQIWQEWCRSA